MPFTRTTIIKSPGKLTFGGGDFFSESGITVETVMEKEIREVDSFGELAALLVGKMIQIKFTPSAWDNLSVLFPYGATVVGEDIFGATDSAAVITPINGKPLTIANCAITQMPSIMLKSKGSQFGECQITGLIKTASDADALASYLSFGVVATGAALTGLDTTKILNGAYKATYNTADYYSEEGYEISFDLGLEENRVDGFGVVGMAMGNLSATASFNPTGIEEAAYLALIGFEVGIGTEATRYALTIEGGASGNPSVVMNNCQVDPGGLDYGKDKNRNAPLTFKSVRSQTSGANDALFTVGTVV